LKKSSRFSQAWKIDKWNETKNQKQMKPYIVTQFMTNITLWYSVKNSFLINCKRSNEYLFWNRILLCRMDCPWIHDLPTSASEYWDYSCAPITPSSQMDILILKNKLKLYHTNSICIQLWKVRKIMKL
jgi:hypothetical protein